MTAKFVKEIVVIDPDSKAEVTLSVFKHNRSGGMFGIDSSYLDQAFDDDTDPKIPDPFETYSCDNIYNSINGIKLTGL